MSVIDQRGAKFYGESCGRHGTYTFYPGLEYNTNGRTHHLMLGNFFNISIKSPEGVEASLNLVGELQLVWHDKNNDEEKLSSVKLYAKPEVCPGGRQPHHGQDEILAEETKVVIRLSHLAELVISSSQVQCSSSGKRNFVVQPSSQSREKCIKVQRPLILSYPQYCRYKSALKRLESVDRKLRSEVLVFLLGRTFAQNLPPEDERQVYFCRDTMTLPDLKHFKDELSHLAPRLKGRKRKKKQSMKSFDSDDSNDSETSPDHIVLRKNHRTPVSIDFALNGKSLNYKKRKASHDDFTNDKESFLQVLHQFMKENHSPIYRSPTLGFKEVDLHQFYMSTIKRGGYKEVTRKKLWKEIYDELGGSSCNTSAATGTRKNYEKFLQPFENYLSGSESKSASKKGCKKSPCLNKPPSSPDTKHSQTLRSITFNKSKVSLNIEPLVVLKPMTGLLIQKQIQNGDKSIKFETSEMTTSPSLVGKSSQPEGGRVFPSSTESAPPRLGTPPDFKFSSNLSTVSQRLLAGGRALLNVKDEIPEQKMQTDHFSIPAAEDDEPHTNVSQPPRNEFLSTVLPKSSPNLLSQINVTASSGMRKIMSNSKSHFEGFAVQDLCVKNKTSFYDPKCLIKDEFEQSDKIEPLDYSMKTLCDFEASSLTCKFDQPLDLSMKRSESVDKQWYSENSPFKSCDSQVPLDLSKPSLRRKDERHQSSLPINLAQLLPLAFAMPLSSTVQVLPQVLSPIQQNINMIYNPGSVNFPILSFVPPSSDMLSSTR